MYTYYVNLKIKILSFQANNKMALNANDTIELYIIYMIT
jgi:hypothetical protein